MRFVGACPGACTRSVLSENEWRPRCAWVPPCLSSSSFFYCICEYVLSCPVFVIVLVYSVFWEGGPWVASYLFLLNFFLSLYFKYVFVTAEEGSWWLCSVTGQGMIRVRSGLCFIGRLAFTVGIWTSIVPVFFFFFFFRVWPHGDRRLYRLGIKVDYGGMDERYAMNKTIASRLNDPYSVIAASR